ncbi:alpha/beta fold hydrolase [Planktothrix sp. FACHB-1355]|uniref:Alpha/beta fold hydrolase n=1 Tax=Aerosakkonema funiforme FACHB-1375 TaxID=2949571 RepID=A0A926ZHE1_9CYAN|nr:MULTISPECIES: alpha/beta fold hydrolase [Oscillatoriales]MBD2182930.1 alpha/beta fold hydrolase [Aerosakkonema funiforme FACHB-1375]MBD3558896.1 alpha/beta fold hydrolase [Planktothrix sp. FACHB-1355]
MRKSQRKLFFKICSTLFIVYTLICVILFFVQPRLIFLPTHNFQKTPDFYKINYKNIYLPVPKNLGGGEIHGWWIQAKKSNLGTLLYLHGRGLNIGSNINQAYRFQQLGFSVFLIDYRGYGKSKGNFPTESQLYQDAEIAWNYLVNQQKIPSDRIFIYGHSLGSAVAIDLAIKHPEAAGLIVQSSFTSMANQIARYPYFRIFPISLLLTNRFDSIKKVKSLRIPALFVHGVDDPMIPYTMSEKLYKAASYRKQLLLVPGAKHNNGDLFFNNNQYRRAIRDFANLSL